jgi:hypothetical protein
MNNDQFSTHPWIIADGHVHLHKCFNLHNVIQCAKVNLKNHTIRLGLNPQTPKVLFLTESKQENVFSALCSNGLSGFNIHRTHSKNCIKIVDSDGAGLYVVAGRQIVTSENLEILALGLENLFPDGQPIEEVVQATSRLGVVAVLPWGAGKWFAKRGAIVKESLYNHKKLPLYLGDNGNRPAIWPLPALFGEAEALQIFNLPGSDPLPFNGEENRVGDYGFAIQGIWDEHDPFPAIKKALENRTAPIKTFGIPARLFSFFYHQLSMQFKKQRKL